MIAGTDCGLAGRVGHPEIVWAKLEDLAAGARLASQALASRSLSQPGPWQGGGRLPFACAHDVLRVPISIKSKRS